MSRCSPRHLSHAKPLECATVCYMTNESVVGVRELRQNLSKYLDRVRLGETLEVTAHGQPVAILAPVPPYGPLESLIVAGRAIRPRGELLGLLPPEGSASTRLSDALEEERSERLR